MQGPRTASITFVAGSRDPGAAHALQMLRRRSSFGWARREGDRVLNVEVTMSRTKPC